MLKLTVGGRTIEVQGNNLEITLDGKPIVEQPQLQQPRLYVPEDYSVAPAQSPKPRKTRSDKGKRRDTSSKGTDKPKWETVRIHYSQRLRDDARVVYRAKLRSRPTGWAGGLEVGVFWIGDVRMEDGQIRRRVGVARLTAKSDYTEMDKRDRIGQRGAKCHLFVDESEIQYMN